MIAHALGNPFQVAEIAAARRASTTCSSSRTTATRSARTYDGQLTGTFGDLTTVSFYPAHHLTMGEGGCVLTSNLALARIVESLRDWGRDCWCEPGENNTLPEAVRVPDGHAAARLRPQVHLLARRLQPEGHRPPGRAGADPARQARRASSSRPAAQLAAAARGPGRRAAACCCPSPRPGSDPSWFGFVITVDPEAPFTRGELVDFLEARQDRHPAAVRRQPDPAPGLHRPAAPGRRRPDQQRHHHRAAPSGSASTRASPTR